MFRNPIFYGVIAFFLSAVIFSLFMPTLVCMDGWESPSIGSSGACSHHGGVDRTFEIVATFVSMGIGYFVWKKASNKEAYLKSDPDKKIEKIEKISSGIFSFVMKIFGKTWNALMGFLKVCRILGFMQGNPWILAAVIVITGLLFPPLAFVLYPMGIVAIIKGADCENDFIIAEYK